MTVTALVPRLARDGVPEIAPVLLSMNRPPGNPVALNENGPEPSMVGVSAEVSMAASMLSVILPPAFTLVYDVIVGGAATMAICA